MIIVITHTDFRLYWPARIAALNALLCSHGHTLLTIEIAGKGSPYDFAGKSQPPDALNWTCLFPDKKMEEIPSREASLALSNKLDGVNPDIVVAGSIAFSSGATAVRWCKSNNKPVVIFDNARLQDVPRSWFVNYIKRCIYKNVDAVISPAPSQSDAFEYWGVEKSRIFFGLNVIDNEWFSSHVEQYKKDKDRIREELDLPDQFILGVGRFIEIKNWLTLLHTFSEIKQVSSSTRWSIVLVGNGPEKHNITHYCKNHPDIDIVIKPFATQKDLCKYYSLATAVILPSFGETWGLVINEAMAAGLPVLVSDQCGCVQSLVEDNKNGYIFPPNDSKTLSEVLQRFMNITPAERILMGNQSSKKIQSWSLDSFSNAVWQAIEHGIRSPIERKRIIELFIIKSWKGRYRPT